MGKFNFITTAMDGLLIIEPTLFGDDRGYFMESYNLQDFQAAGLDVAFVQDNESRSRKGVLRGLHFQINYPQGKLIRVTKGSVFDVSVDVRLSSSTFGQWLGIVLSEENKRQVYIPEGFAHGFLVISDYAEFSYKCTDFYHPEDQGGILWSDPDIGIDWPVENDLKVILSHQDQNLGSLKEAQEALEKVYGEIK